MLSHLRLVVAIARGYLGYGLPHADLIQEGSIGLMKAVKRFDPERNVRLVSFAIHWIKAEIHEYILRNWRLVKLATTKAQRKLFFNLRSMKKGLGDDERKRGRARGERAARKARGSGRDGDAPLRPGHRLRGRPRTTRTPMRRCTTSLPTRRRAAAPARGEGVRGERAAGLEQALEAWTPAAAASSKARWLREKNALTLHDLAAEFKVSAERIRQIEAKPWRR